jgi:hypothetical protein
VSLDVREPIIPTTPARSRTKRLFWPVTGVVAALAGSAYVFAVDPNLAAGYPPCPLKVLTGLDCPGCGGLRCAHALMEGDVAAAFDQNLMAVILLPLAALWLGMLIVRRWRSDSGPPLRSERTLRLQRIFTVSIIVAVVIFTVVRNLPGVAYLPSGIG